MIYNTSLSIITLCILTIIQASLSLHDEVVSKENETTIVTNGTSQITQGKALEKHIVFPSEENSITPKTANSSSVNATNQTEKLPDGMWNPFSSTYIHMYVIYNFMYRAQ